MMRTVILDIGPMAHLQGEGPLTGEAMVDESLISSAGKGIIIESGVITKISESLELEEEFGKPNSKFGTVNNNDNLNSDKVISLGGRAIIPGLVDSHSHLIWAGDRSREVRWRLNGKSYSDIAALGGGIVSTVGATRNSNDDQLFELGLKRLKIAFKSGTTHIESKSGYGLDVDTELRLLEVSKQLNEVDELPSVDHTWLGAHAIPKDMTHKDYFESILSEQLPAIVEQGIARSADVFCEPGWFSVVESEDILKESRKSGLALRIHIDEFSDGGGGELAAELEVDTADHAHYTNPRARNMMKSSGVNTGFLPGTPYSMGSDWPDFNMMIENESPWTIASDFNPNNQILSLPFIGSLLVQRCNVDPLAALVAASRNPSETTPHPSGLQHGRIEVGSAANINILDSEHWESWCLKPSHSPFIATIINGKFSQH